MKALTEPRSGESPPPKKKGWNHSEQVLVYHKAVPELDRTYLWSIAYYHYDPPFKNKPHWVDFNTDRAEPDYWWPLPELPTNVVEECPYCDGDGAVDSGGVTPQGHPINIPCSFCLK